MFYGEILICLRIKIYFSPTIHRFIHVLGREEIIRLTHVCVCSEYQVITFVLNSPLSYAIIRSFTNYQGHWVHTVTI